MNPTRRYSQDRKGIPTGKKIGLAAVVEELACTIYRGGESVKASAV
jgi:hypothetical protein